jgi:hypothetical protein
VTADLKTSGFLLIIERLYYVYLAILFQLCDIGGSGNQGDKSHGLAGNLWHNELAGWSPNLSMTSLFTFLPVCMTVTLNVFIPSHNMS